MTTHATPQASPAASAPASSIASAIAAESTRVAWSWIGLGGVGIASVLVFWLFDALPFQDLPAHAGLIALRHRFAESPFEQANFVLAPHIGPYSLFRFLGEAFLRALGPVGAVRALATLPTIATPIAILVARRRLHGDRTATFGYLAVALSFGLMTLLGFASYLLGVAAMIVALTMWLELLVAADRRESTTKREIAMALVAPLVFVAHGHAFLLFLVTAAVSAIATGDRLRRILRARALLPSLALAGYVAWVERATQIPQGSAPLPHAALAPHFQGASDKLSLLITPTLMTRTGIDFAIGVLVWLLVVLASIATVRALRDPSRALSDPDAAVDAASRSHARALYACAAVVGLAFIVLPHTIGWFGFVDGRLVPVVLWLAIMAIRRPALGRVLRATIDRASPAFAFAMATVAIIASHRFQDEARGYKRVLAAIPEGSRLLNLPLEPNSDIFTAHPFIHYDKLALADRAVVVSDVWFHQGSALYPRTANPALRLPASYSESDLKSIEWNAYRLEDWDYVLIRMRPQSAPPKTPAALALADHQGGWWLYRRGN
jgi:hypothetical protein